MSKEEDFIMTEIEHHINQIELAIDKAQKSKLYLSYDSTKWSAERLNKLADKLDEYDPNKEE